MDKAICALVRL